MKLSDAMIKLRWIDIKWWFLHRFHPKYRYHLIDTGLEPGYYYPREQILYGTMALVTKFYADAPINWFATEEHQEIAQTLAYISHEWLRYVKLKDQIENMWADESYDYSAIEAAQAENHDRAEELLKLVAEIRLYLWYP